MAAQDDVASESQLELRDACVLVTGASGFLGRHLCRELSARGARVQGAAWRSEGVGVDAAGWHPGDLSEPGVASALVRRVQPDVVFHLASRVAGSRDRELVVPMAESNLMATIRLLDAAADHAVARVILCGSLEEPDPGDAPVSPYAASKHAATLYARLYAEAYALPVAQARIFMVYGPGVQDERKLIPYVIRELLAGRTPRLSSGQRAVDWIDVRDVVRGLIALALSPGAVGRECDLGSGKLVAVREVVDRLCDLMGVGPLHFGGLRDRSREITRAANLAETRRSVGWHPRIELEQGLRDTIAWFREH